jgi:hypothetical protein
MFLSIEAVLPNLLGRYEYIHLHQPNQCYCSFSINIADAIVPLASMYTIEVPDAYWPSDIVIFFEIQQYEDDSELRGDCKEKIDMKAT